MLDHRRRSTPSPAARSATAARCATPVSRPRRGHGQKADGGRPPSCASSRARSRSATRFRRRRVDAERRAKTVRNHSATHLMHGAARSARHTCSRRAPGHEERTRFDFAHNAPVTAEAEARVEALVNAEIRAPTPRAARDADIDEAQKRPAR